MDRHRIALRHPRRALILDRDGVLNENVDGYVLQQSQIRLLPGNPEALTAARRAGFAIFVATNQQCVGLGLISLDRALRVNRSIVNAASAGTVLASAICPHRADASCQCRKPLPGMLVALARRFHLSAEHSYYVGDAATDSIAASAAGFKPVVVRTGRWDGQDALIDGTIVTKDLPSFVSLVLGR